MFWATNSLEHMVNNNFIRVPDASHVTYALHNRDHLLPNTALNNTMPSKLSSCVMNDGFASNYFKIEREVRHPLSPLLFILSLEVLECSIRQNKNIQGIKIRKEELKLALFADDLSCFVKNKSFYEQLTSSLENFTAISIQKRLNFFYLGLKKLKSFPHELKTSLKILGV